MKKGEPLICVNRPILLALVSANHTSPVLVLNATIPESELAVGIGNSLMEFSTVVLSGEEIFWMQPILFGLRPGFGRGNSVIVVASGWNRESSLPAGDCAFAGDRPRLKREYPITATTAAVITNRRVVPSFIASP